MSTHSELGTVRNGSERLEQTSPSTAAGGRQPRRSDAQLVADVATLHEQLGRMPTLDEITAAVGGCQRARAVQARKAVSLRESFSRLETELRLPPMLEARHRTLMREWLDAARQEIDPLLESVTEAAEERVADAERRARDAEDQSMALSKANRVLSDQLTKAESTIEALERKRDKLALAEARWKGIAAERLSRINQKTSRVEVTS